MNTKARLLISDVPVHCSESELARWIEAKGFEVERVLLIRDIVSGTSPSFAHVNLKDVQQLDDAVLMLDGQTLHGSAIRVTRLDQKVQRLVWRAGENTPRKASGL